MSNRIFYDSKGKPSSKRVWGSIILIVGLGMAIVDGFALYDANSDIVLYILSAGTVTLGIGVVEHFGKSGNNKGDGT